MAIENKSFLIGKVVSDKMDKTVVVRVDRTFMHPHFKKVMKALKKYKVHDENGSAKVGDIVEFYEARPISKTKYMYLNRVVKSHASHENI